MNSRTRATRTFGYGLCVLSLFLGTLAVPALALAAPAVDLHNLNWYVHVDLIDVAAGEDLAYWEGVIDAAVTSANGLIEGGQGPFDQPCCARIDRTVSVSLFGSQGDGLDVINSEPDEVAISNAGGSGSNAFLVDSLTWCGGSAPLAIGCALRPSLCNLNGSDDPNFWMIGTVESRDAGTLPVVVAHERGHNACLQHVSAAGCQIMQGSIATPGMGGCMTATECSNFKAGRTTTVSGLECTCYDNGGAFLPDGLVCEETPTPGICSGGLCGPYAGGAGVSLIAAADPGTSAGGPPEDALLISALKGEWTTLAQFNPAADDVRGMAYAFDSATLYGVVPTIADDSIVTIDPATGLILATVGTITNGAEEIVSMAYDPGATNAPGDDRLLVLEVSGAVGEIRAIDPATPSVTTLLGSLALGPANLFSGLAYDSIQDRLFAGSPFADYGLWEFDLSSCPPSPCNVAQIPGVALTRIDASLAYSPISGMLYQVGKALDAPRTFYDVIDPVAGVRVETIALDVFSPSALAAVPEPALTPAFAMGAMVLLIAARRRGRG